jgi:hypothetical protein
MVLAGAGANRTVQFRSWGANGRDDAGGGDDLVYPNAAISVSSQRTSNLYVTITNNRLVPLKGILTVQWRDNRALKTASFDLTNTAKVGATTSQSFGPGDTTPYTLSPLVAGTASIQWDFQAEAATTPAAPAQSTPAYLQLKGSLVINLLPGESRLLPIVVN